MAPRLYRYYDAPFLQPRNMALEFQVKILPCNRGLREHFSGLGMKNAGVWEMLGSKLLHAATSTCSTHKKLNFSLAILPFMHVE